VPLRATRGHSISDYCHSLINYISHNPLPGLIIPDCILLCLITLSVSVYLNHARSFVLCKVLFGVTLQLQAGFLGFLCFFLFFFSCAFLTLLLFGLITQCLWLTIVDYPFNKTAFGSKPLFSCHHVNFVSLWNAHYRSKMDRKCRFMLRKYRLSMFFCSSLGWAKNPFLIKNHVVPYRVLELVVLFFWESRYWCCM